MNLLNPFSFKNCLQLHGIYDGRMHFIFELNIGNSYPKRIELCRLTAGIR